MANTAAMPVVNEVPVATIGKKIIELNYQEIYDHKPNIYKWTKRLFDIVASCIALVILSTGKKNLKSFEKNLIKKHLVPQARLKEATLISKNIKITSMTDCSDGLFKSVELLTQNKGAVINTENIPLSKNLIKYTNGNHNNLYNHALFGGEEFELVFTIDKKHEKKLNKLLPSATCIGYINDSNKVTYLENGKTKKIKYNGYNHL